MNTPSRHLFLIYSSEENRGTMIANKLSTALTAEELKDGLLISRLKEPFKENEVEWRISQAGKKNNGEIWAQCLAYITSRAIMDRLDDVVGPENWKCSYKFIGNTGVICELSLKINGEWVTKEDGAEQTDIESFKGGISSALKRAGTAWGMGRYLYGVEAGFANIHRDKIKDSQYGKTKDGTTFFWTPPELPEWALPKEPAIAAAHHEIHKVINQPTIARGPSDAQLKRLFAISKQSQVSQDQIKDYMMIEFKKTSTKDLTIEEYNKICDDMQKGFFTQPPQELEQVGPPDETSEPQNSNEVPWAKYRDVK